MVIETKFSSSWGQCPRRSQLVNKTIISKQQVLAKVPQVLAFRSEVTIPFRASCHSESWDTVILSSFPRGEVKKNWTVVGPWPKSRVKGGFG